MALPGKWFANGAELSGVNESAAGPLASRFLAASPDYYQSRLVKSKAPWVPGLRADWLSDSG